LQKYSLFQKFDIFADIIINPISGQSYVSKQSPISFPGIVTKHYFPIPSVVICELIATTCSRKNSLSTPHYRDQGLIKDGINGICYHHVFGESLPWYFSTRNLAYRRHQVHFAMAWL